jgi:hypothetical protein
MKNINKTIRTAMNRSWQQNLYAFLRNYRTTPHATTGEPPAMVMFGRQIGNRLPSHPAHLSKETNQDQKIRARDQQQKLAMERNANKRARAAPPLQVNDLVIVQNTIRQSKYDSIYNPTRNQRQRNSDPS